jgi:hypothetical protein
MKIYHNYYFSTAFEQLYCIVILLFLLQDTCPTKETGTMYLYYQKQELPMAAMFVNGSELNQHSL